MGKLTGPQLPIQANSPDKKIIKQRGIEKLIAFSDAGIAVQEQMLHR
jgi:hypothetical protein